MYRRLAPLLALILTLCVVSIARAGEDTDAFNALQRGNVYIAPDVKSYGKIQSGDTQLLARQATSAAAANIPEKFVIIRSLPPQFAPIKGAAYRGASALRQAVALTDGVLILIWPHGIGVSSDRLSSGEMQTIEHNASPICQAQGYAPCAVQAGKAAVTTIQNDQTSSNRNVAIFWVVVLAIIAALIGLFVWRAARGRRRSEGRLDELRTAASNTLSMTDTAVQAIESSGGKMASDTQAEYDRALGLRDRARRELQGSTTQAALIQANNDAAQAVLAMQGVMRTQKISSPLTDTGLDLGDHRCFYCSRTDRPPYTGRAIDDGRGNSMQVEVCSFCLSMLEAGRTPQIATVQQDGMMMPWWAVPSTPYYYAYGGPTWQYWLPFLVGMDVGGWFGGGMYGPGYGLGYGYDPYMGGGGVFGGDPGFGGDVQNQGGDMGAGDFGGWPTGGDGGQDWSGGGGGGDWSGGGGDWGGGDSGGGDWGGGGGDWS
jgi:hypothetical protein